MEKATISKGSANVSPSPWFLNVKTGQKLNPDPLWNKTERPHNQLNVPTEILSIRHAACQSGIQFMVRSKSGTEQWLDAQWFEQPNSYKITDKEGTVITINRAPDSYELRECTIEPITSMKQFECAPKVLDHAEYLSLIADAEIGKLVRSKLVSGNSVPVSRCHINKSEVEAIDEAHK